MNSVSFQINVSLGCASTVGKMVPHMVKSFNYQFVEKIAIVDLDKLVGRYDKGKEIELQSLRNTLNELVENGYLDEIVLVPWNSDEQNRVMLKYFADINVSAIAYNGSPKFQYAYGIDIAKGDYILHLDSDMLFYLEREEDWLDASIQIFKDNLDVVFTSLRDGPPQKRKKNTFEYNDMFDEIGQNTVMHGWEKSSFISTRYFLINKLRFEERMLPLLSLNGTSSFEDILTYNAELQSCEKWSRVGGKSWTIHPYPRNELYEENLDAVIELVEMGGYPLKREGFRWDIGFEEDLFLPWKKKMIDIGLIAKDLNSNFSMVKSWVSNYRKVLKTLISQFKSQ